MDAGRQIYKAIGRLSKMPQNYDGFSAQKNLGEKIPPR